MEKKDKELLIYIGLAALAVTAVSVFFIYKFSKKDKSSRSAVTRIDLSVFDSPDMPGSGNCMDRRLLMVLDALSKRTGYPIFDWINSGARSESHNRKVGGASKSSHKIPNCKAVDIGTPSKFIRNQIIMEARNLGIKRIGVGNTFVHIDVDENKSQFVAWGYPSGTRPEVNPFV